MNSLETKKKRKQEYDRKRYLRLKESIKQQVSQYQKSNRKKINEYRRKKKLENPEQYANWQKDYRKRNPWKRHYETAKARCQNKHNASYNNYGGKGIKFLLSAEEVKKLWFRDKAYLMKKPSIDRIKSYKHYTYENCRFLEFSLNSKRKNKNFELCNPHCIYLQPKEKHQSKRKEPHMCTKYNKILKHNGNHPYIVACEECINERY